MISVSIYYRSDKARGNFKILSFSAEIFKRPSWISSCSFRLDVAKWSSLKTSVFERNFQSNFRCTTFISIKPGLLYLTGQRPQESVFWDSSISEAKVLNKLPPNIPAQVLTFILLSTEFISPLLAVSSARNASPAAKNEEDKCSCFQ